MIQEDYVSFEIAKLLKEKGFEPSYDSFRGVYINGEFLRRNPGQGYFFNAGDEIVEVCSLQTAMKWLREAYNIDIIINVSSKDESDDKRNYTYEIVSKLFVGTDNVKRTYEEACEAAIKYCLENLI